jgi:hypothetical protein
MIGQQTAKALSRIRIQTKRSRSILIEVRIPNSVHTILRCINVILKFFYDVASRTLYYRELPILALLSTANCQKPFLVVPEKSDSVDLRQSR